MLSSALLRRAQAMPLMATRSFSTTQRASLARMQVIGRLAADPELVNTASGRELVRYSVASDYGPKDNRQTSWFRIASFNDGTTRDRLLQLQKGTLIHLDADARMTEWEDTEGKKRQGLTLLHRSFEVLSKPRPKTEQTETDPVA